MKPQILIIEDDTTLRGALQRYLSRSGYDVQAVGDGEAGLQLLQQQLRAPDVLLLDLNLPGIDGLAVLARLRESGMPCVPIVMTAYPDVRTAVAALKAGAYDYINKPFDLRELESLVERAAEMRQLRQELAWRRAQADIQVEEPLVGASAAFRRLCGQLDQFGAAGDAPVLIVGEAGVGKEHLARALHLRSPRRHGPWITLDCAASRAEDFEVLLFGGEAAPAHPARRGLLDLAAGGTLLLNGVGELEPRLQPKLLRVLESQTFRRVGSVRDELASVRFVATSDHDPVALVKDGRLRADLQFRLDVMRLDLPPLRERRADVAPLVQHFLAQMGRRLRRAPPSVAPALLRCMERYAWPGNVRELRNMVERLMILSDGAPLQPADLPVELSCGPAPDPAAPEEGLSLQAVELRHIQRVLAHCKGNKTRAAEVLGISRLTLRQRLKEVDSAAAER